MMRSLPNCFGAVIVPGQAGFGYCSGPSRMELVQSFRTSSVEAVLSPGRLGQAPRAVLSLPGSRFSPGSVVRPMVGVRGVTPRRVNRPGPGSSGSAHSLCTAVRTRRPGKHSASVEDGHECHLVSSIYTLRRMTFRHMRSGGAGACLTSRLRHRAFPSSLP